MFVQSLKSAIRSLRAAGMLLSDIAHYDEVATDTVRSWSAGRSLAGGGSPAEKVGTSSRLLAGYTLIMRDIAASHAHMSVERVHIAYTYRTPDWALAVTTAIGTSMLHEHACPDQLIVPDASRAAGEAALVTDILCGEPLPAVKTRRYGSVAYVTIYPDVILQHVACDDGDSLYDYRKEATE